MEDWIREVGKQVPALCVLVWIVWKFLSHDKEGRRFLLDAQERCHDVTERSNLVMQKAVGAMGEVREALHRLNGRT